MRMRAAPTRPSPHRRVRLLREASSCALWDPPSLRARCSRACPEFRRCRPPAINSRSALRAAIQHWPKWSRRLSFGGVGVVGLEPERDQLETMFLELTKKEGP